MLQTAIFVALALLIVPSVLALEIVKRKDWNAKPPKEVQNINHVVPFVIIYHSYTPAACYTEDACIDAMTTMQRYHQDDRGWTDIGYTFAVGGTGKVYEGRGFNRVGAHAPKYNNESIGIVLIGDWRTEVPPQNMLKATQDLIAHAIDEGHLSINYTLRGQCQVRNTECPGDALFNEIRNWPHFEPPKAGFEIVKRKDWNANPPKEVQNINFAVPFVIIHHSYAPAVCYTEDACIDAMKTMQRYHQDDRGWADIGYTFGVGGTGKVYEGRGFNRVGAHAPKYNNRSIGIVLIGDWRTEVPPQNMLKATQDLIAHAIDEGHLSSNYTLYGHRQVRNTECPGDALFNEIRNWPHFSPDLNAIASNLVSPPA